MKYYRILLLVFCSFFVWLHGFLQGLRGGRASVFQCFGLKISYLSSILGSENLKVICSAFGYGLRSFVLLHRGSSGFYDEFFFVGLFGF